MKNDIDFREVAKEIVSVLSKYKATIRESDFILEWVKSEIEEQVVQESKD